MIGGSRQRRMVTPASVTGRFWPPSIRRSLGLACAVMWKKGPLPDSLGGCGSACLSIRGKLVQIMAPAGSVIWVCSGPPTPRGFPRFVGGRDEGGLGVESLQLVCRCPPVVCGRGGCVGYTPHARTQPQTQTKTQTRTHTNMHTHTHTRSTHTHTYGHTYINTYMHIHT